MVLGKDGTRIWDLKTMTQIQDRPASAGIRGATTAIAWTNLDDEPGEMFFFGTVMGYLVGWRKVSGQHCFHETFCKRVVEPSEITALAFDAVSNRFAVSNRNGIVQVYDLASSAEPRKVISISVRNFLPKSLLFGVMRGNERELLAFGHSDGKIRTITGNLDIDNRLEQWEVGVHIGDAAIDTRRATVCIDDIHSGGIIYRLDDHQRVKALAVPSTTQEKRPRQVRFVDDSKAIVIGSDHGIVYIFDRRNGQITDKLVLGGKDWVQTLATTECENIPTIITAKSGDGLPDNDIIVWQKVVDRGRSDPSASETLLSLVLLATLVYAYQHWDVLMTVLKQRAVDLN
ncbi:WD40 repeat-like protein [Mycena sanguinolenta]|uniref:WD40 repeat-like protein n=1 Tax=Mycena sanguinolenta TaxID=230812 RepID=A0A8H6YN98_9AGAR|nr:WD40 repeat-like protein [Mycena sanguinolenta]